MLLSRNLILKVSQTPRFPSPPALLTHDGEDDYHEVKDVPADGEVVVPQGKHFEHTLTGEEDDEDQVNPVENVLHLLALSIRLHHHGHHVKADEHHDNNVKGLLSDKIKDDTLNFVLRGRAERGKIQKDSQEPFQADSGSHSAFFFHNTSQPDAAAPSGYQEQGQTPPSIPPHNELSKTATPLLCLCHHTLPLLLLVSFAGHFFSYLISFFSTLSP